MKESRRWDAFQKYEKKKKKKKIPFKICLIFTWWWDVNAFYLLVIGLVFTLLHSFLIRLKLVGFGQNIHQAKPIGSWVEQPTPSYNHRCQLVAIEVDTVPQWSQSDMRSSSEQKLMVMQKYIDNLCDTYVGEMC